MYKDKKEQEYIDKWMSKKDSETSADQISYYYEAASLIDLGEDYEVDVWIERGKLAIEQLMERDDLTKARLWSINYYMMDELEEDELYDEIEAKRFEEERKIEKENEMMNKQDVGGNIFEMFANCVA